MMVRLLAFLLVNTATLVFFGRVADLLAAVDASGIQAIP